MAKQFVCTQCGHKGNYKRVTKGSIIIEIFLWLLFLLPGLFYSIWRLSSKQDVCPKCRNANCMIPVDSPMAKKLLE